MNLENKKRPAGWKRNMLSGLNMRYLSDWIWSNPEFEGAYHAFREAPELFEAGELINKTPRKIIRKIELPEEYGGHTLVFRKYLEKDTIRFCCRCSQTAQEAANYLLFNQLGIPLPRIAFVGDQRRGLKLRYSWFATEFAEGYRNGACFKNREEWDGSIEELKYVRTNLAYLGRLHGMRCVHRNAKPENFLWRTRGNGEMDILWTDLAEADCLNVPDFLFQRYQILDLADFAGCLKLEEDQLLQAMAFYLLHNSRCHMSPEELAFKVRAGSRSDF